MPYTPTPAGPKGLRQLYHWIWGELRRVSSSVSLGQLEDVNLTDPSLNRDIIEFDGTWVNGRRTRSVPEYVSGTEYQRGDEVSNAHQISEALVDGTSQYPYVTPTGAETVIYTGTMADTSDVVKQVIFGNRYTFATSGYLTGYRIYAVIDYSYSIFSVRDPDGARVVTELLAFIAESSGWITIGIPMVIVPTGTVLDLMAQVQEPAPTPVTWVGNWDYQTPNNDGTPTAGEIIQSDKTPNSFRVSKTDSDAGDRSAELEALTVGDIINGAGVAWSIQSTTDNVTWMDFGVSPAVHGEPDGIQEFTFETVVATPIIYGEDIDWWTNNPLPRGSVQGMLSVGGAYDDIIPDGNAYGTDITVQEAYVPDDWWVKVITPGSTSDVTYDLNAKQHKWVSESATAVNTAYVSTINNVWTEIYREAVPEDSVSDGYALIGAKRTDSLDAYRCKLESLAWRDTGPLVISDHIAYELGSALLDVRAIADGNDIVFQVRGRNGQDWDWKLLLFFEGR